MARKEPGIYRRTLGDRREVWDAYWTGADGRRKVSKGHRAKRDALKARRDGQTAAEENRPEPTRDTVEAYLTRWAAHQPPKYRQIVRDHVVPYVGSLPLARLDHNDAANLFRRLQEAGLANNTVRLVRTIFRKALAEAVENRELAWNPVTRSVEGPKHVKPEFQTWDADEVRRFLAVAGDDRLHALWRLAVTTGMRRGELLSLRWKDVNLERGKLSVSWRTKTRTSLRYISLDPKTVAALREWKRRQADERVVVELGAPDLVFTIEDGRPLSPKHSWVNFKELKERATLTSIRFHDLRHTYATLALASGEDVKVISGRLGHGDVGITLETYRHLLPREDADAAERVAALFD